MGKHPIIQPADYIVLKLMAIANNPDRALKDEEDILNLLKLSKRELIPAHFDLLDRDRIYLFAERFGQRQRIEKLFDKIDKDPNDDERFNL